MITQGNKINFFSIAKAVLTLFGQVWGADSKSVLILFVAGKVLKL